MKSSAIKQVLSLLPATRDQISHAMNWSQSNGFRVASALIKGGYAEEWGSIPTAKGTLAPLLRATGKLPID